MIGRVIDHMLDHLPIGSGMASRPRSRRQRLLQLTIIEGSEELTHLVADVFPKGSKLGERVQLVGGRRASLVLALPAAEPTPLHPDNMRECAMNAAMAALQVSSILLGGKLAQSLEEALIRPPIEGHELGDFLQCHGSSSSK